MNRAKQPRNGSGFELRRGILAIEGTKSDSLQALDFDLTFQQEGG